MSPIVYLCSQLPYSAVSTIAGFCLSKLKTLTIPDEVFQFDVAKMEMLPIYTDALCNWGRGDDLLETIINWLKKGTVCI